MVIATFLQKTRLSRLHVPPGAFFVRVSDKREKRDPACGICVLIYFTERIGRADVFVAVETGL